MTATLISLISILIGIIGAYMIAYIFKVYSLGIMGNTIAGVFGSILFIKFLGRLGFDPKSILQSGHVHFGLLTLNLFVSFIGGAVAVVLIQKLKAKMDR